MKFIAVVAAIAIAIFAQTVTAAPNRQWPAFSKVSFYPKPEL
jgi:hypothetical protein